MTARLVAWCTRHYLIVACLTALVVFAGALAQTRLERDAIPDLSDPHVVLIADWMGHPALEVAERVTTVLAAALDGTTGAVAIRGSSMSEMAFVDVSLRAEADLSVSRADITARLAQVRARLPAAAVVQIGPDASSTSWVYEYVLVDPTHRAEPATIRRLQDDVIRPLLAGIPGVAEVASVGGASEHTRVEASPERLRQAGLAFSDLLATLHSSQAKAAGARVQELAALSIAAPPQGAGGLRVEDVARVHTVADMTAGLADYNGVLPAVGGVVIARKGSDVPAIVARISAALDQARARLPAGMKLVTVYERAGLALGIEHTLFQALAEEIAIVAVVILVFLLHGPSALLPVLTLPLVVLLTFAGMWLLKVPATVMSLGGLGIALGMAIDAEVVALEACHRSLENLKAGTARERLEAVVAAAGAFAPAILTSLLSAALVFLPVFAFGGETGRLLRPLAITKTLVIASAALVALTAAPALRGRLLRGRVVSEFSNPLNRALVNAYRPLVHFALSRPKLTLWTAGLAVVSCVPIARGLGAEFLPRVEEGDLLFMPTTLAGIPAEEAMMQLGREDRALAAHDEVASVFGKVGRANTATDPAPFSMAEITIRLHPRAEWPKHPHARWYSTWAPPALKAGLSSIWPEDTPLSNAELIDALRRDTALPGWTGAFTAPVRARLDMTSTGVRTPVGVRIVAGSEARLVALSSGVRRLLEHLPFTKNAVSEAGVDETRLEFLPDGAALSRYGVDPQLALETVDLVRSGGQLASAVNDAGSSVRVAPDQTARRLVEELGETTVRGAQPGRPSQPVPLALLGQFVFAATPAVVRSEGKQLVSYVYADLSDETSLSEYVERGQRAVADATRSGALTLGPGERIEWTGQWQLLAAGQRRLRVIVPAVALAIFALLLAQFRNLIEALLVFCAVPFALVGSFWTLFLLHYPLSAPVWVGLLSVVGLAMQTGVVMVVYIDQAFFRRVRQGTLKTRADIVAAHAEGTVLRLRPKLMTVGTMALSLLPLLWSEGAGKEILRRVAAPMLGGVLTSALLTLEVLPVLYTIWRFRQLRRAQRAGVPLERILGRPPPWAAA